MVEFLYDLLNQYTWTFPWAPPGYEALDGTWGGFVFSTLSVPLLRLRAGLWNPGLYLGDLFFIPFVSLPPTRISSRR